ncbi:FxSxx-COOH system tetratricopeptide repeat protein [Frankia nepalensis]|uniref:Tetratricopeptide repeat protein n=1 Tax=Frankia nepalensis TaxID=1836974 RepID=A0A937RPZ8_9ACTN|nr:FxSxx-COOH system tetratricopeptide repeat protein [Frankia nepalensis]MBL7497792.1 tetratricopeptide repeat protein [Frankia nepalensis]MBL7511295.1 tetratricopeptide repeat protein [Frankia nepalensis]MBL7629861.1 tetratricopeptide repeat protein [Frankia nepalensis]
MADIVWLASFVDPPPARSSPLGSPADRRPDAVGDEPIAPEEPEATDGPSAADPPTTSAGGRPGAEPSATTGDDVPGGPGPTRVDAGDGLVIPGDQPEPSGRWPDAPPTDELVGFLDDEWAAGLIGPAADAAVGVGRRLGQAITWSPAVYPALGDLTDRWRELRRALGALHQTVPSAHEVEVDEEATARCLADGEPRPVYRPRLERRFELALVVDDNWTMAIWRDEVRRQVAMLERLAVFRDVRVYHLDTDVDEAAGVRLRGADEGGAGFAPARLLEPSRRRVVWLLTDGLGAAWRRGLVDAVLWTWASRLPTAVLSAVPRSTLRHTWLEEWRLEEVLEPPRMAGLPVPLLEADPASIRRFADRVADPGTADPRAAAPGDVNPRDADLPVLVVAPPGAGRTAGGTGWEDGGDPGDPYELDSGPDEARRRVDRFRAVASPAAFDLATRLAAAPITRSVLRRLLRLAARPRRSGLATLAELFAHGLLHPVAGRDDDWAVAYDFDDGLREDLLAFLRRAETMRVIRVVRDELGDRVDAVRHLGAALESPDEAPLPEVTADSRYFVAAEAAAFGALSGPYLPRSRRLREELRRDWSVNAEEPSKVAGVSPSDDAPATPRPRPGSADEARVVVAQPAGARGEPLTSTTHARAQEERRSARPPAIWGNVPPRNPHFTGRVELLANLRARLAEGTTAVLPEALHGMGGVGKSHLAIEYVHRYGREFDLVWWMPAEHAAQVAASMVELAGRLNLPVSTEANTAVPAVLDALRLGQPYGKWLLVFDNADEPRAVRQYFPQSDSGRILVTSRNPNWSAVARPLEVDVFMRGESVDLLRRRLPELSVEDADRLAHALGDLPLAVEQAATWLVETGMAAGDYLRLFEDKRAELLSTSPPVDYELPVQAAWNVSLDRLATTHPAALRLLQVWSFYAPEQISRQIFRGGRAITTVPDLDSALRDPIKLSDAVGQITRYALARIVYQTNSYQMHRLVQAVLQSRMTADERAMMRRAAHLLLAVNDPGDPDDPSTWRAYGDLYPHLLASDAAESTDPWTHDLLVNEVVYLYKWGDHQASVELAEQVHRTWSRTIGEESPDTLRLAGWLGWLYIVVGRYEDAARANARVLELCTQVHGNEHRETLLTMGNVGVDRIVAGDFQGALEISQERLRRAERAYGPEVDQTLAAAHDVGVYLRMVGQLREARVLNEQTWNQRVRVLGEYHIDTLRTLTSLAVDVRELGDYLGALVRHEELVGLFSQVVEGRLDHFQVLLARTLLAVALRKAGRHMEALELSRDVEARLMRRYGKDHPRTIAASLALSVDLRHAGELAEAHELCEAALRRYERLFGETHPYTRSAAVNLAVIHRQAGRPERAHELDVATLEALDAGLGRDHPWSLVAATNLASDQYALGDFAQAHELDLDTFDRSARVLGADHPSTLVVGVNLALDLRALGRDQESEDLLARMVDGLSRVLGADHPGTAAAASGSRGDCDVDPVPV